MLWRVAAQTGEVYLFGSMHVAPPSAYPLHPLVEAAFGGADRLVVEIDITTTKREELTQAMEGHSAMPRGVFIEDIATDNELAIIEGGLEGSPLEIEDIRGVQPWLIELVTTDTTGSQAGFTGDHGMDLHYLTRAHARELPVVELETVDEQIEALAGASVTSQLAWLVAGLVNRELGKGVAYLYELWRSGDQKALGEFLRLPVENDARSLEVYERLFSARNVLWADRLETILAKGGSSFAVIGAGHLAGPGNLIDLLRERGYRVERVTATQPAAGATEPPRTTP